MRAGPRSARARSQPTSCQGLARDQLLRTLATDGSGLSEVEAAARLARYGRNDIVFHQRRSALAMFLGEFLALFPLLLLAAGALSFLADHLSPGQGYRLIGAALLGVVLLNALVSFAQNYRVEKLMLSFLDYIPKQIALLRDGGRVLLDAVQAVPGDVLFVQEGDKIPVDGVLLECSDLMVDESILTGESEPLVKTALEEVVEDGCSVRSGATVLKGSARVLVTGTGRATGLGATAELAQGVERDLTPMQRELHDFVRKITYLAAGVGLAFFALGFVIGNPFWTNLVFAIGIIVANVPEGLLPTVTLALSQSSVRMGRRNALIKHILSVETLGATTVICTDKTGTLTRNRLHVEALYLHGAEIAGDDEEGLRRHPAGDRLLQIMALCNDVIATRDNGAARPGVAFRGDPTETALAEFVEGRGGFESLRQPFEAVGERAFDPASRYMSATFRCADGSLRLTAKGAPEVLLERCSHSHERQGSRPLGESERRALRERADGYAAQGLRVLALAERRVERADSAAEGLVFVGLVALIDPPRPEVPAAVAACRSAGIRIIVISGDKAETVGYIARRLGIVERPRVIEGEALAELSHAALVEVLRDRQVVFARIAPEHKLAIVDALKSMGEVVAMTGDGVNDAPALRRADIGVSMGLRGTDVAKEASDVILLDDNFATIATAIEEGRAVYDNIRKFITYILTSNVPEILPFIAYVLLPIPLPITVIQILAIDLITDVLPAIGLGKEPPEADVMRRPPRRREERLVSLRTFARSYGLIGPIEAAMAFLTFFAILHAGGWAWGEALAADDPLYRQAAGAFLTAIVFAQIGNVMACRTSRQSALSYLGRLNGWIAAGLAVELAFILLSMHLPVLQRLFTIAPLPAWAWIPIVLTPLVVFGVEELRKLLVRSGAGWLAA